VGIHVSWYDDKAAECALRYEAVDPDVLFAWMVGLLPPQPSVVFDIGAGTGRDAAWFAKAGHEVVAVEPSPGMRAEANRLHGSARVRWVADSLPSLSVTLRLGLGAELVLLGAVWQHVPPSDRARAFRKLVTLLKPGGILVVTLRHGTDDGSGGYEVDPDEIELLARNHGVQIIRRVEAPDLLGRQSVRWTNLAMRLPDDGTGALPLLRHVILLDQRASTYKLGLLRAIVRAADGSAGMAVEEGDEHIRLPLGLIALNWLRLYLPLTMGNLPQAPLNRRAAEGLGFAREGWRALQAGAASARDLRIGATFGGDAAAAVRAALWEATDTITKMPANYLTYSDGTQIFEAIRGRSDRSRGPLVLDARTLAGFGSMRVPRHVWRAMQRYSVWIEPALVAEWAKQMHDYAASQGRSLDVARVAAAMVWSDPARDTSLPRSIALESMAAGNPVLCVWSGKLLTEANMDIDHCLPWSVWPCGDLWNLMPSDRRLNQRQKGDRLPSADALRTAGDAMMSWWRTAYIECRNETLPLRFGNEARASLPGLTDQARACDADEVYAAVGLQRIRLSQDQGVPEWTPNR
jgi:SAM-dependent methyltransferase